MTSLVKTACPSLGHLCPAYRPSWVGSASYPCYETCYAYLTAYRFSGSLVAGGC